MDTLKNCLSIKLFILLLCISIMIGGILTNEIGDIMTVKCSYARHHRLFSADCSNLDFTIVPADIINPDTEVLDLTSNRIRIIHNDSFIKLQNIKILYLNNNRIKSIEPSSFEYLSKLETIDLEGNVLTIINFNYPKSLMRLYLGGNTLHLEKSNLDKAYSLQFLSFKKCGLSDVPNIGVMPNLVELDLSENTITNISSLQLAPFCRMTLLHVDDDLFTPEMYCDCRSLQDYCTIRNIKLHKLICNPLDDAQIDSCPIVPIPDETNNKFIQCQSERNFPHWAISSFLFVIFVIVIAIGILFYKKKRNGNTSSSNNKKKKVNNSSDSKNDNKNDSDEKAAEPALLA